MSTVKVYGSSDDLVEVEGDISEEFGYDDDGEFLVAFSDGTLLSVKYDGTWNINVKIQGRAKFSKTPHQGVDSDNYSDVVTLESDGPIKWAVPSMCVAYHKDLSRAA